MIAEINGRHSVPADGGAMLVSHASPIPENGWPLRPYQIVSLLEMLKFWAGPYYQMMYQLDLYAVEVQGAIQRRGDNIRERFISEGDAKRLKEMLRRIHFLSEQFEMEQTMNRVYGCRIRAGNAFKLEDIAHEITELKNAIENDLFQSFFVFIPKDKAKYLSVNLGVFEEGGVFGETVGSRFPDAGREIAKACDCYAIEAYSACVFHLMRAVEMVTRLMIRAMGAIQFLKKGKPIELCTWGELSDALDSGLKRLAHKKRNTRSRAETFEYYSHAVGLFKHYKGAWRDPASHTRKVYQPGETKDLIDNTRQFFQHLAIRLKE